MTVLPIYLRLESEDMKNKIILTHFVMPPGGRKGKGDYSDTSYITLD